MRCYSPLARNILGDLMPLSWSNQVEIAAALLKEHPDMERLSLSHDRLLQMILSLPGFQGAAVPPQPACLDHILWTWMRLADAPSERKARGGE
jgi:FeS assembly protein IscX